MTTDSKSPRQRLTEMKATADMMTTAHSRKRDELDGLHLEINIAISISSVFMLLFALAPDEMMKILFKLTPEQVKFWLGLGAAVNLAAVLLDMLCKFGENAALHAKAAEHFRMLKHKYDHELNSNEEITPEKIKVLSEDYMKPPIVIPDQEFLKLKQHHLRKIEVSKELTSNPHRPIEIIELGLWWKGLWSKPKPPTEEAPKAIRKSDSVQEVQE